MKQSENRWKPMETEKHYTVKEIFFMTGMPKSTIRRAIKEKTLNAYKRGKSYYIPKRCFDKYIGDLILKQAGINEDILEKAIIADKIEDAAETLRTLGKYKDEDLDIFVQGAEKQLMEAVLNFKNENKNTD